MISFNPEGKAVPPPCVATVVMANGAHLFTPDNLKKGIKSDLKDAINK